MLGIVLAQEGDSTVYLGEEIHLPFKALLVIESGESLFICFFFFCVKWEIFFRTD